VSGNIADDEALDRDTLLRQWTMLRAVPREPRSISIKDLQARLRVAGYSTTRRTIERDLPRLSAIFPLTCDTARKPYAWSWGRGANFEFTPRLSTAQSVALLSSRTHLRGLLPTLALRDLEPLFEMADRELRSTGWHDWDRRTAVLGAGMKVLAPVVDPHVLDTVHEALTVGHCIEGRYTPAATGVAKRMKIHPLGLVARGAAQYLVCTLRDYGHVRKLALHRLEDTRLLDLPRAQPDGFELADYVAADGARYQPKGLLRLSARFDAAVAAHLRDTPLSVDQQISGEDGQGRVVLTATVVDDQTLRWWLLGFGARVQVIEPPALRSEIAAECALSAQHYAGG